MLAWESDAGRKSHMESRSFYFVPSHFGCSLRMQLVVQNSMLMDSSRQLERNRRIGSLTRCRLPAKIVVDGL